VQERSFSALKENKQTKTADFDLETTPKTKCWLLYIALHEIYLYFQLYFQRDRNCSFQNYLYVDMCRLKNQIGDTPM